MSLGIQKTFNLDMVPGGAPPVIHVSAGDVGRPFRAVLLYNGELYDLDAVASVKIRGTKPDNTVFEYNLTFDDEDSHVDFVIEEQMAIIAGQVLCEIRLFSGDDTIGSANFILDVETAVYDPEAASESYIPTYETAIQEALENVADDIADLATAAAINDVKQYADDAEAWATGSVDGTDVTSTDDQYHNNAKYYAEQAGEKATAAAGSANAAANSAAQAMSTTPDGYAALVSEVDALNNKFININDTSTSDLAVVLERNWSSLPAGASFVRVTTSGTTYMCNVFKYANTYGSAFVTGYSYGTPKYYRRTNDTDGLFDTSGEYFSHLSINNTSAISSFLSYNKNSISIISYGGIKFVILSFTVYVSSMNAGNYYDCFIADSTLRNAIGSKNFVFSGCCAEDPELSYSGYYQSSSGLFRIKTSKNISSNTEMSIYSLAVLD